MDRGHLGKIPAAASAIAAAITAGSAHPVAINVPGVATLRSKSLIELTLLPSSRNLKPNLALHLDRTLTNRLF
jgi:hypothetical protein